MAADPHAPGVPLTAGRLALLLDLTQALAAAVLKGDFPRAEALLAQRRLALERLAWEAEAGELGEQLEELRSLEERLLAFCRAWREALQERLRTLGEGSRLRQSYALRRAEAQLVDLRE